tara:strand:+ start:224 stop:571 length:348 start_codon:yes stop_codon:yes gene_type:complete
MSFIKDREEAVKNINILKYILIGLWGLNVIVWIWLFSIASTALTTIFLAYALVPILGVPVLIYGLWNLKKWALVYGYVLIGLLLVSSLLRASVVQTLLWAAALSTLISSKKAFEA